MAIWVPDRVILLVESNGSSNGFVWVPSYILHISATNNKFQVKLYEDTIRHMESDLMVAGDFNAKALRWRMTILDSTGGRMLETTAWTGVKNGGLEMTDDLMGSDYQYIEFTNR